MAAASGRLFRLIPSRYPPVGPPGPLDTVTSPDDLDAVLALEGWTNHRLILARLNRLPREDWVYGRANAGVIMAAFMHPSPNGSRFNGPDLGAWYAADIFKGAVAEAAHHIRRDLANTGKISGVFEYREYVCALNGGYTDIRRGAPEVRDAKTPDAETLAGLYDPASYAASRPWGEAVRAEGGAGIVYDSVRMAGGTNFVCYRPPLVRGVEQAGHWRLTVSIDRPPVAQRLPQ
ncbi:MAG: RES family NAD+ phosphorylase [Rhodospirillales bacterium]